MIWRLQIEINIASQIKISLDIIKDFLIGLYLLFNLPYLFLMVLFD